MINETATWVAAVATGLLVDFAVTVQSPAALGAVNNPVLALIVPQLVDHVTGLFAVNCCVFSANRLGFAGLIASDPVTVTLVDAVSPLPLVAVAFTMHDSSVIGAV